MSITNDITNEARRFWLYYSEGPDTSRYVCLYADTVEECEAFIRERSTVYSVFEIVDTCVLSVADQVEANDIAVTIKTNGGSVAMWERADRTPALAAAVATLVQGESCAVTAKDMLEQFYRYGEVINADHPQGMTRGGHIWKRPPTLTQRALAGDDSAIKRLLPERLAESIKEHLTEILNAGDGASTELSKVASFSDVDELYDKNTLGDTEEIYATLSGNLDDNPESAIQLACDVVAAAQAIVDQWIKSGGLRGETPTIEQMNVWFDYENQAWVNSSVTGSVYLSCNHAADDPCGCYGREHAGETPSADIIERFKPVMIDDECPVCQQLHEDAVREAREDFAAGRFPSILRQDSRAGNPELYSDGETEDDDPYQLLGTGVVPAAEPDARFAGLIPTVSAHLNNPLHLGSDGLTIVRPHVQSDSEFARQQGYIVAVVTYATGIDGEPILTDESKEYARRLVYRYNQHDELVAKLTALVKWLDISGSSHTKSVGVGTHFETQPIEFSVVAEARALCPSLNTNAFSFDCVGCKRTFHSIDDGSPCSECGEASCNECLGNGARCCVNPDCHEAEVTASSVSIGLLAD